MFLGQKKYIGFSRYHHPRFVHQKYNGFLTQLSVFHFQHRKHIDITDQRQKRNTHLNHTWHIFFVWKDNLKILRKKKVMFLGKKKYFWIFSISHPRFAHRYLRIGEVKSTKSKIISFFKDHNFLFLNIF